MSLPIDLILVRHGQSEGNAAKRLSEKGDNAGLALLNDRHTRSYRLSNLGRSQAVAAGKWLNKEFGKDGKTFDRFITSEFARAMETSALLDLPDAAWLRNFYLTELDWSELEKLSDDEREEKFGDALRMRAVEPFFWRAPNGESFADLCLRLEKVLQTLHRECADKRVIIVCHGGVMRAFRVLIERISPDKFKESSGSKIPENRIHNCEVLHYTRRDPETGLVADHANWMRRVRPTENPIWTTGWQKIERPRYSNEDLLKIVSEMPKVLE